MKGIGRGRRDEIKGLTYLQISKLHETDGKYKQ